MDALLVLGALPQDGDSIAVNLYGVEDHGTMTDTIQGIQLAVRAESRDSRDTPRLSEQAFDRLHGLTHTDCYYVQLSRAGRHRTDT